jgi:hypothetical protein
MIAPDKSKLSQTPTTLRRAVAEHALEHQLNEPVFDQTLENPPARAPINFRYSRRQLIVSFVIVNLVVWIAALWLIVF